MASKKNQKVVIEFNDVESLLNAFSKWNSMSIADRKSMIAERGDSEKRFVVRNEKAQFSFYDTGYVYVGFRYIKKSGEVTDKYGVFHTIKLWNKKTDENGKPVAGAPIEQFKSKSGEKTPIAQTWTADRSIWNTAQNKRLVNALAGAF